MANTYIVTNIVTTGNLAIVSGTVNAVPVQVSYPASTTFATALLFQAFIQPLMLAAAPLPTLAAFQSTWSA
jgi:hypothetical protein